MAEPSLARSAAVARAHHLRVWATRYEVLAIVGLLAVALAVRLIVLLRWFDVPGDGPVRTILAYRWSRSPHFVTHGTWPPGFLYLAGAFYYVVGDPLISTRTLNLVLGTLTVFAFYLLVRRTYDGITALLSASILALFPLHIGLSASSLSEVSVLFELVAGTYLLVRATDFSSRCGWYLTGALAFLILAEMTRYEVWALIPSFVAYYFVKTRHRPTAISILVVLITFPAFWLGGQVTAGFSLGRALSGGPQSTSVELLAAVKVIWRVVVTQMQRVLPAFIGVGVVWEALRAVRKDITPERGLYLSIVLVLWTQDAVLTLLRGPRMWDRLYLASLVVALPFIFWQFVHRARPRWATAGAFGIAIVSVAACGFAVARHPETLYTPIFVTQQRPTDIARLARWLQLGPHRADVILATHMHYQTTYLYLYFPEIGPLFAIDSEIRYAHELPDFVREQHPALLVTSTEDEDEWPRLRRLLGPEVFRRKPLYAEKDIRVYSLQ